MQLVLDNDPVTPFQSYGMTFFYCPALPLAFCCFSLLERCGGMALPGKQAPTLLFIPVAVGWGRGKEEQEGSRKLVSQAKDKKITSQLLPESK